MNLSLLRNVVSYVVLGFPTVACGPRSGVMHQVFLAVSWTRLAATKLRPPMSNPGCPVSNFHGEMLCHYLSGGSMCDCLVRVLWKPCGSRWAPSLMVNPTHASRPTASGGKRVMEAASRQDKSSVTSRSLLYSSLATVLLIGSTSFGESLFDHLRRLWLVAGQTRQGIWDALLDRVGESQATLWIYGTALNLIVWYWVLGGIYTLLDVTLKPDALRKYKIQPGTNEPVDPKRLRSAIKQVLFNQFVVGLPAIYLGSKLFMWRGPPDIRQLPAVHWVFFQLVFCLLEQEFVYYYVHRLLHSKYIYKLVHKRHHEWTAPIAISAIYCHPIEQVAANLFPPFFGLFLLNAHLSTYWLWFFLAVLFTLSEHSGYHLPFMTSPEVHDFHHYSFTNNFGFLGILDSLHGTDLQYKKSMAYPRHFILKSTKSAREIVPEK